MVAILLVCGVLPPHLVVGIYFCTPKQKDRALFYCHTFTKNGSTKHVIHIRSSCCIAVRQVENRDMQCVILLLTDKEKGEHSIDKILSLQSLCKLP
ncbi:hypothetical protein HU200_016744 [Digitaria exilis]|uniref:Secreted protein n=1 Tax=Digitaria exilis TaxID=1010633 RepID=A0A835F8A0_9POAL|nr:hypothetical protein HU200_016744 [Digitaria exilis]